MAWLDTFLGFPGSLLLQTFAIFLDGQNIDSRV